jgi:deoxyribonuclease IV
MHGRDNFRGMMIFGAHTIDNGGIHMAVRRAARSGMHALQVFTAKPQFYNEKISVRPERVERFRAAIAESEIKPEHVVAHAAYVLSVATPDDEKYARASAGLAKEVERAAQLGIGAVCFHPGSALDSERSASAKRIANAITNALEKTPGTTRLLVENTAGAGRTMGRTAEEIGEILSDVPASVRSRTGYGLDTCHLFASGHDLTMSEDAVRVVLDQFEAVTGEPPSFFHLNDSDGALGSNKDRHVLIGEGKIGVEPFRWLLNDRRTRNVPLILETPQQNFEIGEEDDSPDPYDVRMMTLLRELAS